MTSGRIGVERGERGADLGAEQHAAGDLHRDLHLERDLAAGRAPWPGGAPIIAALPREQVEAGLDEEQVDAALEQAVGLRPRTRRAARRSGSGRATGTWCRARSSRRRSGAGRGWSTTTATSRASRAAATLSSWARSAMPYSASASPRRRRCRSRRRRRRPRRTRRAGPDEVGPGEDEDLVAALELGAAEVVGGEAGGLDAGADGAVVDDDPFPGSGEEVAHGWFSWRVEDEGIFAASWGHLAHSIRTARARPRYQRPAGPVERHVAGAAPVGRGPVAA